MWTWLLPAIALAASPPPGGWPAPPAQARVTSVYDGDTFTLATGDKIRLKWVNTPEMKPLEPFAKEAQEFTERFVLDETVTLILDPDSKNRDSYGRVVAGITAPRGDLSEALLRQGLAHMFIIPPDSSDAQRLIAAQALARSERMGIWSTEAYQGALHMTSFHANAAGDDRENVNGEYMRICNVDAAPVDLTGWRLVDLSGEAHTLPTLTIPVGHTVQVRSGKGTHQDDPTHQLEVYLGSDIPLWNNSHEVVTLFDPAGVQVDHRESRGSGSH